MSISIDYFEGVSPPFLATSAIFAKFAAWNGLWENPFLGEFNGIFLQMLLDLNGLSTI